MKNFRSSNPLYPRAHATADQLWWVDSAWDNSTADYLVRFAAEFAEDVPSFLYELNETLVNNARVNLPGFLPSGDWMCSFLTQFGLDLFGDMGEKNPPEESKYPLFREWEKYPHLTAPVRLYAYLKEAEHIEAEPSMTLLLLTASFTEADLAFLLGLPSGDQYKPVEHTPYLAYSRAEVIAESESNKAIADVLDNLLQSVPAVYNGFMPRRDLRYLLANHSFAESPRYDEVLDEIDRWRNEPLLADVSFGEELNLFVTAVSNPAVNDSTLKHLYSMTHREREWAPAVAEAVKFSSSSAKQEGEEEKEARQAAGLKVSLRLPAKVQGRVLYTEVIALVDFIPLHPNWLPFSFESEKEQKIRLPYGLPSHLAGALADGVLEPSFYEAANKAASPSAKGISLRNLSPYVTPLSPYLKDYASHAILKDGKTESRQVCSYAFAIGAVLGEYEELRAELGDSAEQVPEEWLFELL